jgi:hypothetical protein
LEGILAEIISFVGLYLNVELLLAPLLEIICNILSLFNKGIATAIVQHESCNFNIVMLLNILLNKQEVDGIIGKFNVLGLANRPSLCAE